MQEIKYYKTSKSFTILEVLLVVSIISVIYYLFSDSLSFKQKSKIIISNENLCNNLKLISNNYKKTIKLKLIEDDKKLKIIITPNTDKNVKFNIDADNFYYLDQYNEVVKADFGDLVFKYSIYEGKYCQKYLYYKADKLFIQYPFTNLPELFKK